MLSTLRGVYTSCVIMLFNEIINNASVIGGLRIVHFPSIALMVSGSDPTVSEIAML